ncbi:hypothetical protein [Gillisia hiemivivida]|uniref:VWA domain-containing protein n=1 Tax=Gillisia hiemivivida TaxID=291190 RepID=A0A5C6ZTN6_9FLAO|nr:hypothetical protein [Gillisia hiemivivida]TXD93766.1 hypothetical protein ES724_08895 [Gillisia hiemivivida]
MNFKSSIYLLAIFTLALSSCGEDPKEEKIIAESTPNLRTEGTMECPAYIIKNKQNNLNISILLDLSDRIEQPKSIEKDVAYLGSLSKAFTNHIKTKKLVLLEDRIQLFFNPEPSSSAINEIAENLKISFTKNTPKELIEETKTLYQNEPLKLYEFAKTDANGNKENYPGSDIWRFFKDNVRDYSIDNCHRNILVILTDGYMYYDKTEMKEGGRTSYLTPNYLSKLNLKKSNWKEEMQKQDLGFIPAAKDLQDLEVLVIGINSLNDNNPYALDIIQEYWSQWFREMGIPEGNYKIKNAVIPSNMEGVILDFINK